MEEKSLKSIMFASLMLVFMGMFMLEVQAATTKIVATGNFDDIKAEQTVDVNVEVQGNKGIQTAVFEVTYNAADFIYNGCDWTDGVTENTEVQEMDGAISLSIINAQGYFGNGTVAVLHFLSTSDNPNPSFGVNVYEMDEAETKEKKEEETKEEEAWLEDDEKTDKTDKNKKERKTEEKEEFVLDDKEDEPVVDETWTYDGSSVSEQTATLTSRSASQTTKVDKSYKTGVGLGKDIWLLLAAGMGFLACGILIRQKKNKG